MSHAIEVGGHRIEVSNRDKVLFPGEEITKGEMVDYYRRVAEAMLPHVRDRPVSMQRFPDGLGDGGFYEKELPGHFPDWVRSVTLEKKEDGEVTYVLCQDAPTLVYLADQAVVTVHTWLSRRDMPARPDRMVFDLDPSTQEDDGFAAVKEGARALRDLLRELGLVPFVMTTGSRGLHVAVPLERRDEFDAVRTFARRAAELAARRDPNRFTTAQRKAKRAGRLYLDVGRNAWGQTGVAPYSLRARPGAPVATPLEWEELGDGDLGPRSYRLKNLFRRLGQRDDPWAAIADAARPLGGPRETLDSLRREEMDEEEGGD